MKLYRNRLIRLGVYFIKRSGSSVIFSNFFLLGFRGDYIFLHMSHLAIQIRKVALFLKISKLRGFSPWLLGPIAANARLIRWVSTTARLPYCLRFGKGHYLFFWKGRYFSIREKLFNGHLIKFLRVDGLLFIGGVSEHRLAAQFQFRGVPAIAISHPASVPPRATYSFLTSRQQPGLLIFYIRLLALFLNVTVH